MRQRECRQCYLVEGMFEAFFLMQRGQVHFQELSHTGSNSCFHRPLPSLEPIHTPGLRLLDLIYHLQLPHAVDVRDLYSSLEREDLIIHVA